MGWLKELWKAVLPHWWALMSCAISNIVGIYGMALHKNNPWLIRSSFILAGVFVIVAIALAWRDEHKKLVIELARNESPVLDIKIDRIIRTFSELAPRLLVYVYVVNHSYCPTSIRSIRLKDAMTGSVFDSVNFRNFQVPTKQVKISLSLTEDSLLQTQSREMQQVEEVFSKSELLVKNFHKGGWLLFLKADMQSSNPLEYTASIQIEDGCGVIHDSGIQTCRSENLQVFL